MTIRLQRFGDHRVMPWKNGLGVTREVIAHPSGSDASDFLWRISLATVNGSGPFSPFPGIDRTIAVMAGEGMRLTVDGVVRTPLTTDTDPFSFSGDAVVQADSLGGETLDLNVMTRRGLWRHTMQRLSLPEKQLNIDSDAAALVFSGRVEVKAGGCAHSVDKGDVLLGLAPGDQITLAAAEPTARAFFIQLHTAH
ncbi:HutD family protein [Rhizobium sp. AAP43]|uniref:HutD/Ves family protein n=1 Tax=Rhizobium sp. AAP43 TaxID=1523420 RepID=UPI000A492CC2|nr:HutD family protein [Rhizobium sp. AAP43]